MPRDMIRPLRPALHALPAKATRTAYGRARAAPLVQLEGQLRAGVVLAQVLREVVSSGEGAFVGGSGGAGLEFVGGVVGWWGRGEGAEGAFLVVVVVVVRVKLGGGGKKKELV